MASRANAHSNSKRYQITVYLYFTIWQGLFFSQIQATKAQSDLAYDLQAAITKQSIKDAEMQIKVEERAKQIEVQQQEILRREKELEAQVKKPAEAEKYR